MLAIFGKSRMKLSIIIPLFNKVDFVCDTIQSVLNQTLPAHELIIVDDASTDNSLPTVQQFLANNDVNPNHIPVNIIALENNAGPGNARNIGAEHASGDFIAFLDADDVYDLTLIEKVSAYKSAHNLNFMVLNIRLFPSQTQQPNIERIHHYLNKVSDHCYFMPNPLLTVTSPHFIMGRGSNVIVQKTLLLNIKYHAGSRLNEGIDFWYRVLKQALVNNNANVALITGDLIQVREVPGSLSRKSYRHWQEIESPPSLLRYTQSHDIYDKLLMYMIGARWVRHSLKNLSSLKQRVLFLLSHKSVVVKASYYAVVRRFIPARKKLRNVGVVSTE